MLNHCGTLEIKTKRLLLREFRRDDAADMFHGWMGDERVARHTSWYAHTSIDDTRAYIAYILNQDAGKSYNWVIVLDKKPIGTINVCYIDEYAEICGVAYALAYDFWGKGIASEALKAVIRYLFDRVNCRRIIAGCDAANIGSRRVLEKAGMKQEACLRQQIRRKDGSFGDDLQFGLFKDEFQPHA